MKIRSAEFLVSAVAPGQYPSSYVPEVAFAGKSNVGKSSLINCLLNRKGLVKTSSTPGKTRQINFFLINETFRLVDLPGYGYAKVPRSEQDHWERLVTSYLRKRDQLRGVVMIVDARHPPSALDKELRGWLAQEQLPFLVVANKVDKLTRSAIPKHLKVIREGLNLPIAPLPFSAAKKTGRLELWAELAPILGNQGSAGAEAAPEDDEAAL